MIVVQLLTIQPPKETDMSDETNELIDFHEPPKPGTEFDILLNDTDDSGIGKREVYCCKCNNATYCAAEQYVSNLSLIGGQIYSYWVSS